MDQENRNFRIVLFCSVAFAPQSTTPQWNPPSLQLSLLFTLRL